MRAARYLDPPGDPCVISVAVVVRSFMTPLPVFALLVPVQAAKLSIGLVPPVKVDPEYAFLVTVPTVIHAIFWVVRPEAYDTARTTQRQAAEQGHGHRRGKDSKVLAHD